MTRQDVPTRDQDSSSSTVRGGRTASSATIAGVAVALAGSAFVAQRIVVGWSDYGTLIAAADWGWLIAAFVLALTGMTAIGLVWRPVIGSLGSAVGRRDVLTWYYLGQLGKYVPGAIWSVVGRAELATRGGLRRSVAYNSVALSMAATYLCAGVVCACLLPLLLLGPGTTGVSLGVFALVPLGLILLHPKIIGRAFRLAERITGSDAPVLIPPWKTSVALVVRHAPGWIANGLATWAVALVLDPSAPALTLVFAGILSWGVGFAVVFVPGGIGVREGIFTALASVAIDPEVAAAVAILSRLLFVGVDAVGATTFALLKVTSRRPSGTALT